MPRSGLVNTRIKPRVTVLRGFDPNAPMTLTQSLPAFTGVSSSTGIYSGQLVSAAWDSTKGSYAWVLGLTGGTGANACVPHIALQDIADQDVSEAGKLTGLSCAGQFEIQTAYYTGFNATTGKVGAAVVPSTGSNVGSVALSTTTGEVVLGYVTRAPIDEGMQPGTPSQYAQITISPSYTGGSASATGAGAIFYPGIDSSALRPSQVITFATAFNGFKVVV